MYSAGGDRAVRRRQAPVRPAATCSTPACSSTRAPVDADLRLAARLREPRHTLRLAHDGGSVIDAVHRCTGVGKCVADNTGTGGVMCPSYLATRDEKDSTRGRARVLQEMVNGDAGHGRLDVRRGARGPRPLPVLQGLRLATARPASTWRRTRPRRCTSSYRRRLRPRSHYALGQLPRWARLAQPVAPAAPTG